MRVDPCILLVLVWILAGLATPLGPTRPLAKDMGPI